MSNTTLSAQALDFQRLNEKIRAAGAEVCVRDCCGQRFIGAGLGEKAIPLYGTPGNALGAYLDGASIRVYGNAQDAVGDTMNGGQIIIHGGAGDALGYAMRGGSIYVRDSAGYRTGIHMKEYGDQKPVIVVGGRVGSFLGEYLAGGVLVVLGLGIAGPPAGDFIGAGMHGGKIFLRTDRPPAGLPDQVTASAAGAEDLAEIEPWLQTFARCFGTDAALLLGSPYTVLRPNTKNPYKQLYVAN